MKLSLRIEVGTYRGTREGVPRLLEVLERHGAGATFLFSLGPDHSGLLYGKLLPGPDIGKRCAATLRRVRDAGFEVGLQGWDRAKWLRGADRGDARWTSWQMALALHRFRDVFGEAPAVHGAAAWRMNVHAFRSTQSFGFHYASDTRGTHPFIPVVRAEIIACPQFPTTLPLLGEAGGVETLLQRTAAAGRDHVFTLHAEAEGARRRADFERLLEGWKAQGYELVSLGSVATATNIAALPLHRVGDGPEPAGSAATQGPPFLAEAQAP